MKQIPTPSGIKYRRLKTRSTVNLENIHVEDGPIFPWLHATQYFQQNDDTDKLSQIINMIDVELNNGTFTDKTNLNDYENILCNKEHGL